MEHTFTLDVDWNNNVFSRYELILDKSKQIGNLYEYVCTKYSDGDIIEDYREYHGTIYINNDHILTDQDIDESCRELIRNFSPLPLKTIGYEN